MRPTLFGAWPSIAEEPEIAPSFLLGMTGCPWRCAFCNVAHRRDAALLTLDREALSHLAAVALDLGARTLQLTGGEPLLHAAALSRLLSRPLPLPVVLNTALALPVFPRQALWSRLDRVIASVKFGSDACASRLAGVTAYSARTRARLLALKRRGVPLLLRHLLMPGHLDCCTVPVLRWAERGLPGVPLTLLSGYIPPSRSPHAPELARCLAPHELERAHALATTAGTDVRVAGEYDGASRSQGVCPAGSRRAGPEGSPLDRLSPTAPQRPDIALVAEASRSQGVCPAGSRRGRAGPEGSPLDRLSTTAPQRPGIAPVAEASRSQGVCPAGSRRAGPEGSPLDRLSPTAPQRPDIALVAEASRSQGVCPAGSRRAGGPSDIEIIVDASGGICFAGFHPACEALVRGAGLAPGKQRDR